MIQYKACKVLMSPDYKILLKVPSHRLVFTTTVVAIGRHLNLKTLTTLTQTRTARNIEGLRS